MAKPKEKYAMTNVTMSEVFASILRDAKGKRYNAGLRLMSERATEFDSKLRMQLTGLSMVPDARAMANTRLDDFWSTQRGTASRSYNSSDRPEVIIGSGFHAATYAATRAARGLPKPTVLERSDRVGGVFASSKCPTFYLNSRNRPGLLGLPGQEQALNVLPGAPIQPSDLDMSEYQTNEDMAWVIRLTLALFANVRTGANVTGIGDPGNDCYLTTDDDEIYAKRILDARGLGDSKIREYVDGKRILDFPTFLASLDARWPMRDMSRVAVIGGGDSGRVAVEALLGIGPSYTGSIASLDYVREIDWYATDLPASCEDWYATQRSRYSRIGGFLPRAGQSSYRGRSRLQIMGRRGTITPSLASVIVNGQTYDRVIVCTGQKLASFGYSEFDFESVLSSAGSADGSRGLGTVIAKRYASSKYYRIGPAADIPFSRDETDSGIDRIAANKVAMFRLANRTAALAVKLD
jgi:hypothetical protein